MHLGREGLSTTVCASRANGYVLLEALFGEPAAKRVRPLKSSTRPQLHSTLTSLLTIPIDGYNTIRLSKQLFYGSPMESH